MLTQASGEALVEQGVPFYKERRKTMKLRHYFLKLLVCALPLVLTGCSSDLWVTKMDFDTLQATGPIQVRVTFNLPIDQSTVKPGTSLILAGSQDANASGNLQFPAPNILQFTTAKSFGQIVSGGTDAGFTVTLKKSIRAMGGNVIDECKKGVVPQSQIGTEKPGDCVLTFTIPG